VGDVQEPEKVNDAFIETMHVGTMGGGFTVFSFHNLDVMWKYSIKKHLFS
jgi:hypothetical protein